jgi:hypothetical protein
MIILIFKEKNLKKFIFLIEERRTQNMPSEGNNHILIKLLKLNCKLRMIFIMFKIIMLPFICRIFYRLCTCAHAHTNIHTQTLNVHHLLYSYNKPSEESEPQKSWFFSKNSNPGLLSPYLLSLVVCWGDVWYSVYKCRCYSQTNLDIGFASH